MNEDAFVDEATREVLGVAAYLSWLEPDSPGGQRRARALSPYGTDEWDAWKRDLERTRATAAWAAVHADELGTLRDALSNLPETDRPVRRLRVGETLDDSDLFAVKRLLYYGVACLESARGLVGRDPETADWISRANALMAIIHPEKQRSSRFHLASGLDDALAVQRKELRAIKRREGQKRDDLEAALLEQFEGRFDIRGHFRPAPDTDEDALRADPRLVYAAGAWQLEDTTLDAIRAERDEAEDDVARIEQLVRTSLTTTLIEEFDWLQRLASALSEIDVQLAKSRLRDRVDGSWPRWSQDAETRIVGGTDFGVLRMLEETDEAAQPVDVELGPEPTVVSGPNMGGKSALLRLIGLSQWAAQHGLPVPAEACSFAPVDTIVYVGSEEPLAEQATEGLSSFGREVRRLVSWWDRGGSPRLWLLDEVGRGTHPDEGARIARDIIDQLADRGDRCVAATHFPMVAGMEGARKLRIAGLTDPTLLDELLQQAEMGHEDDPESLQRALRAAMDYRPLPVDEHDVPRDARVVARALGLTLDDA